MEKDLKLSRENDGIKETISITRGITSKHYGDFYCLNCPHSVRKKKLESLKNVCENKDFCDVIMPSEDNKILEFNQYQNYWIKRNLLFMQILNV